MVVGGVDRAMDDQTALRLVGGSSSKIAIIEPVDRETVQRSARSGLAARYAPFRAGRSPDRLAHGPSDGDGGNCVSLVSVVCSSWWQPVAGDAAGKRWQPLKQLLWLRCAGPPAAEVREWCLRPQRWKR